MASVTKIMNPLTINLRLFKIEKRPKRTVVDWFVLNFLINKNY